MFKINVHCFQLLFLLIARLKKEHFRLRIISYFHFHGHLVNHILDHLSSISETVLALSSHPKVLPKTHKKLLLKIGDKTIKIGSKSGGGLETCLAAQQGRRGWGTTH